MAWGLFTVLRERNARFYLTGVIVSGFGDSAMSLAAGVWVKELTGSSSLAALVSVCAWVPALLGPLIGTLTDRVRRRPLLIATSLALAATMTAPLTVHSQDDVWLLFTVLALVGVGAQLTDSAETALVASAIPGELRGDFNGLVRTAIESTKLLGPLAGATLFTVLGGPTVAALDALTFLLAALAFCLIRVHEPAPTSPPRRNWWAETAEGLSHLWRHPTLRLLVLAGGCAMTASSLRSTATYALIDTGLHRPAALAGVIALVQGIGSIISGLTAGALLRRVPARHVSAIGLTVCTLGTLAWTTPWLPVVLGGSLVMGLGLPWPLISAMTTVQAATPGEVLGRVAASANTIIFAPTGLALLVGSAMVATLDYRIQLLSAAALGLAVAALLMGTDFTSRFKTPAAPASEPTAARSRRTGEGLSHAE
ncbi:MULTISPECIES: MFS transporter [Streptomyces]|uniref:MFS transporter n=1 Tax=Streptomyces mordarskii TaxID=1226758 RepID=A0ABN1DF38_9ACTN|nr:MFS transporter [Streptomyces antimycoticus]WTB03794.1 MFS transporter [Streptomyces antimycoticus]